MIEVLAARTGRTPATLSGSVLVLCVAVAYFVWVVLKNRDLPGRLVIRELVWPATGVALSAAVVVSLIV